jgi:hypothetical protein
MRPAGTDQPGPRRAGQGGRGLPARRLQVDVEGGVVTLAGRLERRSQAFSLAQLAGLVDGVVAVRDRLTYERDDLGTREATTAR